MPLSDTADPLIREVLRIRNDTRGEIRRLYIITGTLFLILAISIMASLYLRSRDLSNANHKAATEQIRTCFRAAQSRPELRSIANDETLSDSMRGFVKKVYENTPTVGDCKTLADRLHTSIPKEFK